MFKSPVPCSCTGYTPATTTDHSNILFETKAYMDSFEVTIESAYIPLVQPSLSSQWTATLRISVTPYETEVMINEFK